MPAFALDLDPEGIGLLRQDGDGWTVIDRVAVDDPDMVNKLKALRDAGSAAAGRESDFVTTVIIPKTQILYAKIDAPDESGRLRDADVKAALTGVTTCPIEELVFDWRKDEDKIRVAALDVNTLREAEAFADTHGFRPIRFSAWPDEKDFPLPPDFGPTERVRRLLAGVTAGPERRPAGIARTSKDKKGGGGGMGPGPLLAVGLLGLAGLVWALMSLIPWGSSLPDLADTPRLDPEEVAVEEPRLAPKRSAPVLQDMRPLPLFPDALTAPEIQTSMALRRTVRLPQVNAPDPETEVGILTSALTPQTPPRPLIEPVPEDTRDLYLAAIDSIVTVDDAYALVAPAQDIAGPISMPTPPEPGQVFDIDDTGFVVATPDGALTPNGVLVIAGVPPLRPPVRPTTAVVVANPEAALALAGKQPRARPDDLVERRERAQFGGRTVAELQSLRPRARPVSAQQAAISTVEDAPPSDLAVAVSRAPTRRPADFAAIVAATQQALQERPETNTAVVAASAAAVAPAEPQAAPQTQPRLPTTASVARQATIEDALNLRRLNLIGVYGTESNRRALIRLPSGRYVKVKVGDRIDGGQIAEIREDELIYVKGGRNQTLTLPSS